MMPLILRDAWWAIALALVVGCGAASPFDYQQVSGKVTYDDGTPISPSGFTIYFSPQVAAINAETHPRVAKAMVDGSGNFTETTSHKFGDGLIPAKHKVFLDLKPAKGAKPLVAAVYTDVETTPLEVDSTATNFLEIKVPRPQ
ncbi:hypothetical protein [Lacipirellula sp.]|uniref:hypothetical protein n=1 Tax=Lacipirellula sp. TaxID=2691419 RepID=UPI003D0F6BA7